MTPGDSFGEIDFFQSNYRNYCCICVSNRSKFFVINREVNYKYNYQKKKNLFIYQIYVIKNKKTFDFIKFINLKR